MKARLDLKAYYSLLLVAIFLIFLSFQQASALPVSYNTTTINLGLASVPRNSSSYDVFTLNQDMWLWEKFDNNTIDSSPLNVTGTVTYHTNAKDVWHFQNTLTDSTIYGNTLIKQSGSTTYIGGHEGQGISFDGLTYFNTTSTAIVTGAGDRTIEFFIKTPATFVAGNYILSWGSNANNNLYAISWSSTAATSTIQVYYGGGAGVTASTTIFQPNNWYQVAFTLSTGGTVTKIYVNGALDNSAVIAAQNTSSSAFNLGAFIGGVNLIQSGTIIDELRIYSSALTLQQIQALNMLGHYSQSHTLDGGEYITTGNSLPTGNSPRTITAWVKPTKAGDGSGFFGYGTAGAGNSFNGWILGDNSLSCGDLITNPTSSPILLTIGSWNYIACVYDGSHILGYINGNQVFNISYTETTGSSNLIIGARYDLAQTTGQIDNLKVYPYALSASQITSDFNSISPISSGKQFMSWYHGVSGSSTLTNKIGPGSASLTLACSPTSTSQFLIANNIGIDYICPGASSHTFYSNNIMSNTNSILWHTPSAGIGAFSTLTGFVTKTKLMSFTIDDGLSTVITTSSGNTTLGGIPSSETVSNQKVHINGQGMFKYHFNGTALVANSGTDCDLLYLPTNTTKSIDSIACDRSVPANTIRYWNGMNIQGSAIYYTNSTFPFLTSIDNNSYKKLLSLPCEILVNENPCETFIASDFSGNDNLIVLTSTHVYFKNAAQANSILLTHNYALQSYDVVTTTTTSAYQIPNNPLLQSMRLFGFNVNQTLTKTGLFTIPSSNSFISTTLQPAIRLIDPRWTNDATDIPVIYTTSSLFPIFLTASNAPAFSAIKVTQGNQIINGQEAVYAVAQLDSSRSVEFDLPSGDCANIYIADISVSPSIWNFQGIICATGVNQKTIAYTNTVPFTFYTLKYGVTDSFTPANNGLTTTFRTSVAPTTYTVIIKNSTGTTAINQTFTIPANQTIDTRNFNVSGVTKPAALSVLVAGNQVYSAYLGSPLSLANMASFFHQYFNYQGFDFLSFIPVVFASMFTRNTVGVGMALTVVCIATLSWLSIVVVPEPVIYVSIFISVLGLVGYRSIYG